MIFVLDRDLPWGNVVDSDSLFVGITSCGSHQSAQRIFSAGVLPIRLH